MSKYGVISGTYFPVFSPNRNNGPEITPYLDIFHEVSRLTVVILISFSIHIRTNGGFNKAILIMTARLTFSKAKSRLYINVEWLSFYVVRYQFFYFIYLLSAFLSCYNRFVQELNLQRFNARVLYQNTGKQLTD